MRVDEGFNRSPLEFFDLVFESSSLKSSCCASISMVGVWGCECGEGMPVLLLAVALLLSEEEAFSLSRTMSSSGNGS